MSDLLWVEDFVWILNDSDDAKQLESHAFAFLISTRSQMFFIPFYVACSKISLCMRDAIEIKRRTLCSDGA